MSDLQSEKRHYKRVQTPRLAVIASAAEHRDAFVEDISVGGVQLRNADAESDFSDQFHVGDQVDIEIEDMSPLTGCVVRVKEPMMALTFPAREDRDIDKLIAEIMDWPGPFSLHDPEAYLSN